MCVRPAAVAGTFYPADANELAAEVDALLDSAASVAHATPAHPVAVIAPHAGHRFSGRCAAAAYTLFDPQRVRRIVLTGPTHRVGIGAAALSGDDWFATPLGRVRMDAELQEIALDHPAVVVAPPVHAQEHSLEVHLPFLQRRFPTASVLPVAVGDVPPAEVASLLDTLMVDDETVCITSSDLSHFETAEQAARHDRETIDRILALDSTLTGHDACGVRPVNGLLEFAKQRALCAREVAYYHSGDTPWGGRDRVVGYTSIAFEPTSTNE